MGCLNGEKYTLRHAFFHYFVFYKFLPYKFQLCYLFLYIIKMHLIKSSEFKILKLKVNVWWNMGFGINALLIFGLDKVCFVYNKVSHSLLIAQVS
jgi:hypothetical protein